MRLMLLAILCMMGSLSYGQSEYDIHVIFPDTFKVMKEYHDGMPHFPEGLPDGKWCQFHKGDSSKVAFLLSYKDGQPHGEVLGFHTNKKKRVVGFFRHGKKWDEWTWWFDSGRIDAHETWKDNKQHGLWVYYDTKGRKTHSGYFRNGKKSGLWVFYDKSGRVTYQARYKKGRKTGKSKNLDKYGNEVRSSSHFSSRH